MSLDDAFTVTHVKNALEHIEEFETVLVTDDGTIFEAYTNTDGEISDQVQEKVQNLFSVYSPKISKEKTTKGEPYLRIEITGLINNQ